MHNDINNDNVKAPEVVHTLLTSIFFFDIFFNYFHLK